jgi:hypothetical protein
MEFAAVKRILSKKEPPELYDVVEPILADVELRHILVEGSFDKNEIVRYNCARVLFRALGRSPESFYSYWDRFAKMLESPNGFHRSVAAQAIASLAAVDSDGRLNRVWKAYIGLLDDDKVMVSHYFIETLDKTCRARPDLQTKIFGALVGIDRTQHPPARKELLRADILTIFDTLFDTLTPAQRQRASAFAKAALTSSSPKTRKAAKSFVAKHK